jgi:ABC-type amino acid transport substrate-binding protein
VVPKTDAKNYASQEDLKGETVGAQVGTAFVDALKKTGLFSEVKVYDTIPDILRDVNAGRLKAGFADYPILAYNLKQGNFAEVRLVDSYKPVTVGTGGDRNPQERHRVAGQDQRLARQAQGKRQHRQDSRKMGTEGRRLLMS